MSAETTSRGVSPPRPRCSNRFMNSSQIKLGSLSENSNAASLALSIRGSAGLSGRAGTVSAGAGSVEDVPDDESGQGGRSGCRPCFKTGTSKQAGALCAGDCVWDGGAEALGCAAPCAAASALLDELAASIASITVWLAPESFSAINAVADTSKAVRLAAIAFTIVESEKLSFTIRKISWLVSEGFFCDWADPKTAAKARITTKLLKAIRTRHLNASNGS